MHFKVIIQVHEKLAHILTHYAYMTLRGECKKASIIKGLCWPILHIGFLYSKMLECFVLYNLKRGED